MAKLLERNPLARKAFQWAIVTLLYVLEQQRLIDYKKIERVSLDWNRGTLDLGDHFTNMLMARAFGQYVIDRHKKKREVTKQ